MEVGPCQNIFLKIRVDLDFLCGPVVNTLRFHCRGHRFFLSLVGELRFVCSVQFSHSVVFDSLWPLGLQHARLPCPSPAPGACSNSCPSSQWCHPTIWSSVVPFSIFPSIRGFPKESVLCIRWPKHWSFSFSVSPSNEYSGDLVFP